MEIKKARSANYEPQEQNFEIESAVCGRTNLSLSINFYPEGVPHPGFAYSATDEKKLQ